MANIPLCICPSPHPNIIELPFSHKEKLAENKHIQKDINSMKEKKKNNSEDFLLNIVPTYWDVIDPHYWWFHLYEFALELKFICTAPRPDPPIKTGSLTLIGGCEQMWGDVTWQACSCEVSRAMSTLSSFLSSFCQQCHMFGICVPFACDFIAKNGPQAYAEVPSGVPKQRKAAMCITGRSKISFLQAWVTALLAKSSMLMNPWYIFDKVSLNRHTPKTRECTNWQKVSSHRLSGT